MIGHRMNEPTPKHERLSIEIHPVDGSRLRDLDELFLTSSTTRGCRCMWFIATSKERHANWGEGNKRAFEELVRASELPVGLLAYSDGLPIGWCATGPRSRYPTAYGPRTKILKGTRDPGEDDSVWLVPCFFVRVGYRGAGTTRALLNAAAELAGANSAVAIEGFPVVGKKSTKYLGTEKLFEECGFSCIDRPMPGRAVMRRELR